MSFEGRKIAENSNIKIMYTLKKRWYVGNVIIKRLFFAGKKNKKEIVIVCVRQVLSENIKNVKKNLPKSNNYWILIILLAFI